MRMLGIDFGDKKVGLAMSDMLGITAHGLEIIKYENEKELILKIAEIIKTYKIEKIVLGMPKNMDGSIGFRGEKTQIFADKLKSNFEEIPIVFWDERLSTSAAKQVMIETGTKRKNKQKVEDKIAAIFILRNYMESL